MAEGDYKNIKTGNYQELIDTKNIPLIKKAIAILKSENIDLKSELKSTKKLLSLNKKDIEHLEAELLKFNEGENELCSA